MDTDKKVVVVHDGATAGGFPAARKSDVEDVGIKTFTSDGAISEVYALVKFGSASNKVLTTQPSYDALNGGARPAIDPATNLPVVKKPAPKPGKP